jgi:hypothetical protein
MVISQRCNDAVDFVVGLGIEQYVVNIDYSNDGLSDEETWVFVRLLETAQFHLPG